MKPEDYKIRDCVPYQTCPVCTGIGVKLAGGQIPYNQEVCDVCHGKKIIPMFITSEEKEDIKPVKV